MESNTLHGLLLHAPRNWPRESKRSPEHTDGASKARFFTDFGFRLDDWETLARALREHAQRHDVSAESETGFGPRYEVDGPLSAPDGRAPRVRTVWQLDHGEVPRG